MVNKPQPSAALAEMLQQDGELDRILDGRGLTFDSPPAPPAPPPQSFYIPPPDWDEEERERLAVEQERERQRRAAIVAEELAKITDPVEPPEAIPAKPKRRWRQDTQP